MDQGNTEKGIITLGPGQTITVIGWECQDADRQPVRPIGLVRMPVAVHATVLALTLVAIGAALLISLLGS